jgi:lipopolysaccharide transport system ATP-binding protein
MSRPVIHAEGLGKRYRRGLQASRGLLRDSIARTFRSPLSVFRRVNQETFWALQDVSLEVGEGEVLGLIGRNGSGKTTLLKILSRITQPTAGWAEIHGRVGSLLEVGTGFHPELTGRENTYLSGAILGMGKSEITRKFDEIVAFAELEKFIDTPVKHYSSGMFVRLAFAVAAHLEPEILLVDEVLAVGDIRFQRKCLGKMGEVASAGRTVVLVSHNMAAISALSTRVVMLEEGSVAFNGRVAEATVLYYSRSMDKIGDGEDLSRIPRDGTGKSRFSSIKIEALNSNGDRFETAYPGCDLNITVQVECHSETVECNVALIVYDLGGYRIVDTNTGQKNKFLTLRPGQKARVQFVLHDLLLKPGKYLVGLWLGRNGIEVMDHIEHAATLDVMESEETSQHSVIYPGTYLCRFENYITLD